MHEVMVAWSGVGVIHKRPRRKPSARAGQLPFRVGKTIANGGAAAGPGQGSGYYSSSSAADERHPLSVTAHNGPFAIWLISAAPQVIQLFPSFLFPRSRVPPSRCSHCLPVIIVIICCKLVGRSVGPSYALYGDFYPHSTPSLSSSTRARGTAVAAAESSTGILFPPGKREGEEKRVILRAVPGLGMRVW